MKLVRLMAVFGAALVLAFDTPTIRAQEDPVWVPVYQDQFYQRNALGYDHPDPGESQYIRGVLVHDHGLPTTNWLEFDWGGGASTIITGLVTWAWDTNYLAPGEQTYSIFTTFYPDNTSTTETNVPYSACVLPWQLLYLADTNLDNGYPRWNDWYWDQGFRFSNLTGPGPGDFGFVELSVSVQDNTLGETVPPTSYTFAGRTPDTNGTIIYQVPNPAIVVGRFAGLPGLPPNTNTPPGTNYDYSVSVSAQAHQIRIAADRNRDGSIDFFGTNDLTMPGQPLVFWVNNDNDVWGNPFGDSETDWFDAETSPVPGVSSDYDYNYIHSERDLEDFTRLDVLLPAITADTNWNWEVRLEFAGRLGVFLSPCGGFEYLTDSNIASMMIPGPGCTNPGAWYVGEIDGTELVLPAGLFTGGICRLLIEAGSVAAGPLSAKLYRSGDLVSRAAVEVDFKDIKDLYERYTVGNSMSPGVDTGLVPAATASGPSGGHFPEENGKYLLFVHGWNMPYHEKSLFAETALKRLYWQGYKGRFGLFMWPTFYFQIFVLHDGLVNYDRSEHNAWRSGQPLLGLLQQLDSQYPGQVRLMAHSMGNIPAGEALRLAGTTKVAHSYVAMQAALAAHCYDGRPEVEPIGPGGYTWMVFDRNLTTANCYAEYPFDGGSPYLTNSAGAGTYHSYLNPEDYALVGLWDLNQRQKPDGTLGYHYSTPSGANVSGFHRIQTPNVYYLDFPSNTFEIFSFGAESRSVALGASAAVEGVFVREGAVKLDLQANQGYTSEHRFHSGQFLSTILQRRVFWDALVSDLDLRSPNQP